jgi:TonB family protein
VAETGPGSEDGSVGLEALAGAEVPALDAEPDGPVVEDSAALLDDEELAPESETLEAAEAVEEIAEEETGLDLEEARPVPVEVPPEAETGKETGGSRKTWLVIAIAAGLLATVGAGIYFLGGIDRGKGEAETADTSRQASLGAPLPGLASPAATPATGGAQAPEPEGATSGAQASSMPEQQGSPAPPPARPEPVSQEPPVETAAPEPARVEPEPVAAKEPPSKPAAVSLEAELLPEEGELPSGEIEPEDSQAPTAGLDELPSVPLVEDTAPLPSPEEVEVVDTSAPKAQRGALVDFANLDVPPRTVVTTKPEFPRFAAMQGITGKVFVNVLVTEDGTVAEARAVTGPHKILSKAAVDAIKSWRYTAPVKDGVQVKTWKTEIIVFK